ncbi:interferon alpha-inducible protein 27-like protein 2 [Mytilus trossulus]|uniref:interferon alpha-inducible protein 27-like protein 2 n=1 Tax=Mytilus trossulus TaxID=6551 RepID=UPI0030076EB9
MDRRYITVCVFFVLFGTSVQGDDESTEKDGWTSDDVLCATKKYGGGALLGVVTVTATPYLLGVAGFTGAGIAAGSAAAKLMSMFAVYNGGGVIAGGVVATCQSVGAAGLSFAGKTAMVTMVGGTFSYLTGGCAEYDIDCIKKPK